MIIRLPAHAKTLISTAVLCFLVFVVVVAVDGIGYLANADAVVNSHKHRPSRLCTINIFSPPRAMAWTTHKCNDRKQYKTMPLRAPFAEYLVRESFHAPPKTTRKSIRIVRVLSLIWYFARHGRSPFYDNITGNAQPNYIFHPASRPPSRSYANTS